MGIYSRVHGMRDPKMLGGESLVEIQIIMLVKQTVFKILKVDCRKTFDFHFFLKHYLWAPKEQAKTVSRTFPFLRLPRQGLLRHQHNTNA